MHTQESHFQLTPELTHPGQQFVDVLAEQKPFSAHISDLASGQLDTYDVFGTVMALRHSIVTAHTDQWTPDDALESAKLMALTDKLYFNPDPTAPKNSFPEPQANYSYYRSAKRLDAKPSRRAEVTKELLGLSDWAIKKGIVKAELPLAQELTATSLVTNTVVSAEALLLEIATASDNQTDTSDNKAAYWEVQDVFNALDMQMKTGELRVYLTHGKSSANYYYGSHEPQGTRSINIRAEDAQDMGYHLEHILKGAGVNLSDFEAEAGMTLEEVGIRYVFMHELGHALQMVTRQPLAALTGYLMANPRDSLSANFHDAYWAEGERFAEGLALHYLKSLLVQTGFDAVAVLDEVTRALQANHLISYQEWYDKAANSSESLGVSVDGSETQSNGAKLGYGLPLDGAELLDRLSFVAECLRLNANPSQGIIEPFIEKYGDDWWPQYLQEQGIDLAHVQKIAQESLKDSANIQSRRARRDKITKKAKMAGLFGLAALAGGVIGLKLPEASESNHKSSKTNTSVPKEDKPTADVKIIKTIQKA